MKRLYLLTLCLLLALGSMHAQQRNLAAMKTAACAALAAHRADVLPPAEADVAELRTLQGCSVLGTADGRFAVVTADGRQVLGVGTQRSPQGSNPNFEWWLQAADQALAAGAPQHAPGTSRMRPNPKKFPISVQPMLTTHWGQMDPYNRKCPVNADGVRTAVGCMATSMAQVLNYYQEPEHGVGQRTIYYPYQDSINGTPITVDFAAVNYRWDLLGVANFKTDAYTDEQADAIATLMLHCGVATDMRYGTEAEGGSAATPSSCGVGLRDYLQQHDAQVMFRDGRDDEEWMDLVFGELSTGHPLIYGGQAFTGGHSFVLGGYDRNGLVYVNWGWNGDDEGYFDINLLNPGGTSFADEQHLMANLCPTVIAPNLVTVGLAQAGTLATQLNADALTTGCTLSVSGPMNEADFEVLRSNITDRHVWQLDLSQATFDALPDRALYGCHELRQLTLPQGLRHIGDGALGDLRYLEGLDIVPASDADFTIDGDIVYNLEKTEIICALSTISGTLAVEPSVTAIHPYAFAGCVLLEKIDLPATITTLGAETFRNCFWLEELKVRSKTAVELTGYDVFDGVDMSVCALLVPSGLKTTYSRRAQWKNFNDIREFGTTVKATSTVRKQGEPNPEFGYSITGDPISGTPYLYTDADIDSPVGRYTIFVTPGTITAPDVDYVNGILIVEAADAISDIQADATSRQLFDLQGRRTTATRKGVYVELRSDGQTVKRHIK